MPREKKKIADDSVAEKSVGKAAVKAATAGKTRSTKAKATATAEKPTTKSVKKAVKNVENKTAVKKTKAAAPKTAVKSVEKGTVKKAAAPAPKRAVKGTGDQIIVQGKNEYTFSEIMELCKKTYRNGTRKQIKSIKIYIKAEKNALKAYYVVNDNINGSVDL